MTRHLIPVCMVLLVFATDTFAAGPYDGSWAGEANGTGSKGLGISGAGLCNGIITATVTNNVVTGSMQAGRTNPGFGGRIDPDGNFKGHMGQFAATGKFSGSTFSGSYTSTANCTEWRITLNRSGKAN